MIKLILDKEALEHGHINLYTNDDIEVDESLSIEILTKTPCYDLAVSSKRELIELECDIEDLDKIDTQLFLGKYELEGQIYEFTEIVKFIKNLLKKKTFSKI